MEGEEKTFQASGRALVKTERIMKEPLGELQTVQHGWNRCE